jgi:WD40 repeat protein
VAGNNLVGMKIDDKYQKIIPTIEGSEGITAIAINRDGNLLAVANRSDHGMITIYNVKIVNKEVVLKKKVNLTTEDHTAKEYISLCFGNEVKTKSLISLVIS